MSIFDVSSALLGQLNAKILNGDLPEYTNDQKPHVLFPS